MKTKDHSLILRRLTVLVLLLLTGAAIHKYLRAGHNNYLIFVMPFQNLLEGKSIYGPYPELYIDTYKYSPTFAWLMGLFYFLPLWLGALLWNSLNSVMLVVGLWYYLSDEKDADRARWVALLIVVAEALITTQNMQSNNLIVGAMLLGIYHLRRQHSWAAAFFFVLCGFVKFYGIGAAIFFLFYRRKPQFLLAMTVWTLVFALLPATIISFDALRLEYIRWFEVVVESKLGQLVSVLGILESWFGMVKTDANLRIVEAAGIVLFLLPFLRFNLWSDRLFQRRMVAYFLLFVIIFNKMAESPTYVLAVTGVALWWIALEEKTLADKILLGLVIVFTSLSPTDLFPKFIRNEFFVPYNVKAVPCVLVWLRLQWQLWTQSVAVSDPENKTILANQPLSEY